MVILNNVENMDILEYTKTIPDKYVNTIILDPPYFKVVNEKWDNQWKSLEDYLQWMEQIASELSRISKYSCSCWLFGFPYQLGKIIPLFEKNGFTYKQTIVIDKGMKSAAGRVSAKLKLFPTTTEYIIYFYKEARHIVKEYLQDKIKASGKTPKEINIVLGKAISGGGTWSSIAGKKQKNIQYPTIEDWKKLEQVFGPHTIEYKDYIYKFNLEQGITDVWRDINFYDRTFKKYHPTQKPYKLIERIILCSSEENDIVFDGFMGSHMTALVCKKTSRNYLGCELDINYSTNNLLINNN
jgi:DNA modification methylase